MPSYGIFFYRAIRSRQAAKYYYHYYQIHSNLFCYHSLWRSLALILQMPLHFGTGLVVATVVIIMIFHDFENYILWRFF